MPKNQKVTTSEFYCTKCGSRGIPIVRRVGKQREAGHLKKLYCLNCKEEVNHVEVKQSGGYTIREFQAEFEKGNFENGERLMPYREFIGLLKQKGEF